MEVTVIRCGGLDVHKDTVMAAVRTHGEGGRRREVVREFRTFTDDPVALGDWLRSEGVTQVAMEDRCLLEAGLAMCWKRCLAWSCCWSMLDT